MIILLSAVAASGVFLLGFALMWRADARQIRSELTELRGRIDRRLLDALPMGAPPSAPLVFSGEAPGRPVRAERREPRRHASEPTEDRRAPEPDDCDDDPAIPSSPEGCVEEEFSGSNPRKKGMSDGDRPDLAAALVDAISGTDETTPALRILSGVQEELEVLADLCSTDEAHTASILAAPLDCLAKRLDVGLDLVRAEDHATPPPPDSVPPSSGGPR